MNMITADYNYYVTLNSDVDKNDRKSLLCENVMEWSDFNIRVWVRRYMIIIIIFDENNTLYI